MCKADIKDYIISLMPIDRPITYLDASCGEDDFIFQLRSRSPTNSLFVGNDVSIKSLSKLQKRSHELDVENILLTNHSSFELPYADAYFDVSLCKNTFHHMRDTREVLETIKSLLRVTRSLIIVSDFERPDLTGRFPHLVNSYYQWWRNDAGNNFFDEPRFKKLFENPDIKNDLQARQMTVTFDIRKSLFGKSMTAVISKEPSNRHVRVSYCTR